MAFRMLINSMHLLIKVIKRYNSSIVLSNSCRSQISQNLLRL